MKFCPNNLDRLSENLGRNCQNSALFCPDFSDILNIPYPPFKKRPVTEVGTSHEDWCGLSPKQSHLEANDGTNI